MLSTPYKSPELRLLIQNVLQPQGLWSANAEELILATCAIESQFGVFRKQVNGPALGIYQMEPLDHDDIWTNFVAYQPMLMGWLISLSPTHQSTDLIGNDKYATAMCRVHYLRNSEPLPDSTSLSAIWTYYKTYYNTAGGAATENTFYHCYHVWVTDGKAS